MFMQRRQIADYLHVHASVAGRKHLARDSLEEPADKPCASIWIQKNANIVGGMQKRLHGCATAVPVGAAWGARDKWGTAYGSLARTAPTVFF